MRDVSFDIYYRPLFYTLFTLTHIFNITKIGLKLPSSYEVVFSQLITAPSFNNINRIFIRHGYEKGLYFSFYLT